MSAPMLALFDCDGTLVDGQHLVLEAMRAAWAAYDLGDPAPAAVRSIIGLSLHEAVTRLLPEGATLEPARLVEAYSEAYRSRRLQGATDPAYPGIDGLLQRLHDAGATLGVVTGKSSVGLRAVLEAHGWTERFVTLQTADRCPSKPDPAMVLRALEETGASAERTVVIGDTRFDMAMARAAGVEAVGVAWGYHPPEDLLATGACMVAQSVEALGEHLARRACSPGPAR